MKKLTALARILKLTTLTQKKKIKKFFNQCTIYLLSFNMDVFFKGMLQKNQ